MKEPLELGVLVPGANDLQHPFRNRIALRSNVCPNWATLAALLPQQLERVINGQKAVSTFKLTAGAIIGATPGGVAVAASTLSVNLFQHAANECLPLCSLFDGMVDAGMKDDVPNIADISANFTLESSFYKREKRTDKELVDLAALIYTSKVLRQAPTLGIPVLPLAPGKSQEVAAKGKLKATPGESIDDVAPQHEDEAGEEKAREGADAIALKMLEKVVDGPLPPSKSFEAHVNKGGSLIQFSLLREYPRAVVRVAVKSDDGNGYGSGFLTTYNGHRLIATNNHVLPSINVAQTSYAEFDFTAEGAKTVKVKFRPDAFFYTSDSNELDFTLVAFEPLNPADAKTLWLREVIPLKPRSKKPRAVTTKTTPVFIFQHPGGRPLEFSFKEIVEVVLGNEDQEGNAVPTFLRYTPDTERGSSGSPVLNGEFDLVAIHHKGPSNHWNEGVLISAIRTALDKEWTASLSKKFTTPFEPASLAAPPERTPESDPMVEDKPKNPPPLHQPLPNQLDARTVEKLSVPQRARLAAKLQPIWSGVAPLMGITSAEVAAKVMGGMLAGPVALSDALVELMRLRGTTFAMLRKALVEAGAEGQVEVVTQVYTQA